MQVKINFSEEILNPIIKEHLETGRAVQSIIQSRLSFYEQCLQKIAAGLTIYASKSGNYTSEKDIILKKSEVVSNLAVEREVED